MTHDDAKKQIAALFEGRGSEVQRTPLLEHLRGCESCRAEYDRAALAMRRMLGTPDQMTPEELWLFEPPLPPAKVVPLFRPGRAIGFALAAGLAAFVLWYSTARSDEFGVRGGPPVQVTPSARAMCLRGNQVVPVCADGDVVLIAVSPRGLTHVTVLDGERVVGEGDVSDGPDLPIPWAIPFRAGLQASVRFSKCATCEAKVVTVAP